jgi:hypothetical protein
MIEGGEWDKESVVFIVEGLINLTDLQDPISNTQVQMKSQTSFTIYTSATTEPESTLTTCTSLQSPPPPPESARYLHDPFTLRLTMPPVLNYPDFSDPDGQFPDLIGAFSLSHLELSGNVPLRIIYWKIVRFLSLYGNRCACDHVQLSQDFIFQYFSQIS